MNERIEQLTGIALDQTVSETWTTLDAEQLNRFSKKLAELVAKDCIGMIQAKMPRNGANSPENLQSKKHINDISTMYGFTLPLGEGPWYEWAYGKPWHEWRGYTIGTQEGYDAFVAKRNESLE